MTGQVVIRICIMLNVIRVVFYLKIIFKKMLMILTKVYLKNTRLM